MIDCLMPRRRLVLVILGSTLGLLIAAIGIGFAVLRHALPPHAAGPAADELARSVERAVAKEAWDRTGAVRWTFLGRHEHLWDRSRGLSRVRWGTTEVLVELGRIAGRAYRDGREVGGPEREALVKTAYGYWVNDSFWLNPMAKLFDEGVSRFTAQVDGRQALLVRYMSGGLTPGDSYLYLLGPDGTPLAWRLWVSVLPVGGVEASFTGWSTLGTGARIATDHAMAGFHVRLTDVAGARTLAELEPGPDPFARLP